MISDDLIKMNFLGDAVQKYGEKAVLAQKIRISENKLKERSGNMLDTLQNQNTNTANTARMVFFYKVYQRFHDIKKRGKIYNRIFYWFYCKIAEYLQRAYTEEMKKEIKNTLNTD